MPRRESQAFLRGLGIVSLTAFAVIAVVTRGVESLVSTPAALIVDEAGGRGIVRDVVKGSTEWVMGIRPGAAYERIADGGGATVTQGGTVLDVPDAWAALPITPAVVSIALLLGAVALWRGAPGLARYLLVPATLVAVADLAGRVVGVGASIIVVAPAAAATLVVLTRPSIHHRSQMLALASLAVSSVMSVALVLGPDHQTALAFGLAGAVPAIVSIVIAGSTLMAAASAVSKADRRSLLVPVIAASRAGQRLVRSTAEAEHDLIAQRLHDRVMPRVVAGMHLLEQEDPAGSSAELQALAGDLREMISTDQLMVLRDGGLSVALVNLAASMDGDGPQVIARVGASPTPPWDVAVATLRIAQEGLRNACHHASADVVLVRLESSDGGMILEVADDGIGIAAEEFATRSGHIGIASMRARAAEVGGTLEVLGNAPRGTRVRFRWKP